MKPFKELQRNSKKYSDQFPDKKLVILGDTATQFLTQSIKGYGYLNGINLNIFEADYNQIEPQVLDENSEIYKFAPDYILIYMATEKSYESFYNTKTELRTQFAENYYAKIQNYWEKISQHKKCIILFFTFVEIDDNVFGNYAGKTQGSFLYQTRKLNMLLMEGAQQYKNVFLVDLSTLQNRYGRISLLDEKYLYTAKMALSLDILPYVAKQVVDVINALIGHFKKCVVLDLDNTLWGGVIGDDGINNIQIGDLGTGHAFSDFQWWLKQLRERGILLAVCSKNNEDTAKEPFEKHPEMVLHLEDIAIFVANWDDKVTNIRFIQQALNIGIDSMVFLDDNPFERGMVKSMIPEIEVPELPEDPAMYLSFLKEQNLFETVSYSEEDLTRTEQYQAEIGRNTLQKCFESIDDYLINLDMKAEVKRFDPFQYPRIAQLSQRSNQFNLRTVRYTESEIEDIAKSDQYIPLCFMLTDNFGDHGLISVVILEKREKGILFVNTWLMSCRVLKRGMEEFIINSIIKAARENGFNKVIGEYIKTSKNAMVQNIYEKMGFTIIAENTFEAETETFNDRKTFIMEK